MKAWLMSRIRGEGQPTPVTLKTSQPETIIISPEVAVRKCKQLAESLVTERDMVDLMNFWMQNELEDLLKQVMSNTTYYYTMFDAYNDPVHKWLYVKDLREKFAAELYKQGFTFQGPGSEYGRCFITLRGKEGL